MASPLIDDVEIDDITAFAVRGARQNIVKIGMNNRYKVPCTIKKAPSFSTWGLKSSV
jgi:hypothetical protein